MLFPRSLYAILTAIILLLVVSMPGLCALRCMKHLSFDGTPCGLAVQGLHLS